MKDKSFDRRSPRRNFDISTLPSFIRRDDITDISLIPHGKSNTNYKISTRKSDYILRLYSNNALHKELYILKKLKDLISVPEVLFHQNDLALLSFIPGQMLSETPELIPQAGRFIAQMNRIVFETAGQINPDGSISSWPFDSPSGFFGFIMKNSSVENIMGPDRIEKTWKMLEKYSGILNYLASAKNLVHGDFNPENIITENGKICGIIDWEFCLSGSSFMDIGNLMRHTDPSQYASIKQNIIDEGMDLPEEWETIALLIDFSSYLEFLTTDRSSLFKRKCIANIDKTLKKLG